MRVQSAVSRVGLQDPQAVPVDGQPYRYAGAHNGGPLEQHRNLAAVSRKLSPSRPRETEFAFGHFEEPHRPDSNVPTPRGEPLPDNLHMGVADRPNDAEYGPMLCESRATHR